MELLLDVIGTPEITLEVNRGSSYFDLLSLLPEHFSDSSILSDCMNEFSIVAGSWRTDIDELKNELHPRKVDVARIKNLADLLGYDLGNIDTQAESALRNKLLTAIEWYKMKGTYRSISYAAYTAGINIIIYDMYTNDYSTFVTQAWFVGNENENPTGLDATYYKSPHFGIEMLLNTVYAATVNVAREHLWYSTYEDDLIIDVEKTRPINTVPHYWIKLAPYANENGTAVEVDGKIQALATLNWTLGFKYFDDTDSWQFDTDSDSDSTSDIMFDTPTSVTTNLIDTWRLGTGNKTTDLFDDLESDFDFEDSSPTEGSIAASDITTYDDRVEIEITVPEATTLSSISELGIFTYGNTSNEEMVIFSKFPDIYKDTDLELRILITILRE